MHNGVLPVFSFRKISIAEVFENPVFRADKKHAVKNQYTQRKTGKIVHFVVKK